MAGTWFGILASSLMGLALAVAGLARLTALAWLRSNGVRTTGRVVRLERDHYPTPGQQRPYAAVAEFEANGRRYDARGASAFPPLYREGDPVPVYYPPDRPDRGRIVTGREFAVAWFFLALGVVFWSVAVAIASLR
jgi:hypothetical protein